MKKSNYNFLIFIIILFIFTGCNKEKVITEEKEPILQRTSIEYTAKEYRLPVIDKFRDYNIIKVDKNKIYILVDFTDEEIEENPWKELGHKNLIVYNFQNEEILKNIELDEYIEIKDLIVDTGTIYIIYKDLSLPEIDIDDTQATSEQGSKESYSNEENQEEDNYQAINTTESNYSNSNWNNNKSKICIAKFNENYEIDILDRVYTENLIPKFVIANDTVFYSYEESGFYGIKEIKDSIPRLFYKIKDELIGNIYSNNKNIFALVRRGDNSYYYSISTDGKVKEFYIEVREELSDYDFLKNGIISSFLDINNNEMPKLMYIDLNNSKKNIFDNNIITNFVTNNTNNCLMIDTASNVDYLYIKDKELFTSKIEEYNGNNYKFYENENKRYGITDLNRKYIYIDIYFE